MPLRVDLLALPLNDILVLGTKQVPTLKHLRHEVIIISTDTG
jgi:hypothetical protein